MRDLGSVHGFGLVRMSSAKTGSGVAAPSVEVLAIVCLAVTVTALPIGAHLIGQAAGIVSCVVLSLLLANFAVAAVPAALLCAYLFQNLVVSLVSPWIAGVDDFNAIRGYNFLLTATVWLVLAASYWTTLAGQGAAIRKLMGVSTVALGLVFLYFVLGVLSDPKSAAIYLRNIATPLMMFQACLVAAVRSRPGIARPLAPLGYAVLAYGYAELLVRGLLFGLINADSYMGFRTRQETDAGIWLRELRETGRVIRSAEDALKIDFLNTPLLADLHVQVYRLMGPNFHSISYAYALSFFALLFLASRRRLFVIAAFPLLLVIGSKGALVCIGLCMAGLAASRFVKAPVLLWLFGAALVLYAGTAIAIGLRFGDYHVIGLLGGIGGFLQNPFGHGLGSGGNLSINMTAIDWSRSQALGKTDQAVESAVGVLLFQMGIAGAVVCLTYAGIALNAWRSFVRTGQASFAVITFGLLCVDVNGLLQEEALFAPLGMGSLMALAGLALGQAHAASPRDASWPRGVKHAVLAAPARQGPPPLDPTPRDHPGGRPGPGQAEPA